MNQQKFNLLLSWQEKKHTADDNLFQYRKKLTKKRKCSVWADQKHWEFQLNFLSWIWTREVVIKGRQTTWPWLSPTAIHHRSFLRLDLCRSPTETQKIHIRRHSSSSFPFPFQILNETVFLSSPSLATNRTNELFSLRHWCCVLWLWVMCAPDPIEGNGALATCPELSAPARPCATGNKSRW